MKRLLAIAALPLLIFSMAGCDPAPPPYYAPPPPAAIANEAYHNGYEAARRDMAQGWPPQVDRHPRFQNPPAPPGQPAEIYRRNFHRGYDDAYRGR